MSEQAELLDALLATAREAGAIINEVYASEFAVDYKSPRDPVTAADRRANTLICERIAQLAPGAPIVAEESDPATFGAFRTADRVFFVDPLDGTREFVDRNDQFVVMIGLVEHGRPLLAAIHAPVTGISWAGIVGVGAFVETNGKRSPIRVSSTTALSDARIVVSRSHRSSVLEEALELLGARSVDPLGSAGLKCAEVAIGDAEAYVSPGRSGKRWDIAAGEAIVVAAGGRVTDARGAAIDYGAESLVNDTGLVVTNGHVHDAILERIAAIPRKG